MDSLSSTGTVVPQPGQAEPDPIARCGGNRVHPGPPGMRQPLAGRNAPGPADNIAAGPPERVEHCHAHAEGIGTGGESKCIQS